MSAPGLSPLARGNRLRRRGRRGAGGPIPACAGQPLDPGPAGSYCGAYPRLRGATVIRSPRCTTYTGLSPLARGNHHRAGQQLLLRGPIPACAGQPTMMRARLVNSRPIPACAGQPATALRLSVRTWAYPRLRGATCQCCQASTCARGLSPLARGNLVLAPRLSWRAGPIPACAGQPTSRAGTSASSWAYPRLRGATISSSSAACSRVGLSPLARGNLVLAAADLARVGPIPACAGQPGPRGGQSRRRRAYPRLRGATSWLAPVSERPTGLSPLARGNLLAPRDEVRAPGPIPACAGQPARTRARVPCRRAYPRLRGATAQGGCGVRGRWGLSPLARGNLQLLPPIAVACGPIPACAGQPFARYSSRMAFRAYPRLRGATQVAAQTDALAQGLSPLARGNQDEPAHAVGSRGPIPACAGQPCVRRRSGRPMRAYPRLRGATSRGTSTSTALRGLSPLARGNP